MKPLPLLASLALALAASSAFAAPRPNIVFVLFDDMGYGEPKCYRGDTELKTPNLDRLAAEGMRFTDAHSAAAVCTPTRYGVLTGRYNAPHFPIEPPDEWLAKVKGRAPQLEEKRAKNVAFVEHLDHAIGRVLAVLEETGHAQNTVVVFTADNGGSLPHAQNNGAWRGGKQDHYDGGLRVPFLVRWPAQIKAGSRSDYAGLNFDLFPTFIELAGGKPLPDLDAVSLVPVLEGGTLTTTRDLYFVRREGGLQYGGKSYEAIIRGDWKLMQNDPFSPLELYNLKADPQEKSNLAATNRTMVNELSAALRQHIQHGGATPWQAPLAK